MDTRVWHPSYKDPQMGPHSICGNSHMGGCQNYGLFLGPLNTRFRMDPKRDHNFDNHPYCESASKSTSISTPPSI